MYDPEYDEYYEDECIEKSDEQELYEDDCRERARDMMEALKSWA
jgi:hypothetical protein